MKTAGRTLLRHFRGNFELDEMYPYGKLDIRYDGDQVDIRHHLDVACLLRLPEERVRRIRVYSGHYPYVASELLGGEFIRLTLLRDPVERTISLLRQFRRKDPWADPNLRHSAPMEGLTLEQVYENPFVYEPLVLNHQTKIFSMTADDPARHVHGRDRRRRQAARPREGEPRQGRLHRTHRAVRRVPRRARGAHRLGHPAPPAEERDPAGGDPAGQRRRCAAGSRPTTRSTSSSTSTRSSSWHHDGGGGPSPPESDRSVAAASATARSASASAAVTLACSRT